MVFLCDFNSWCKPFRQPWSNVKIQNQPKNNFPRDTKQRIQKIAIKNGWNTHIVQIFCEKCDGKFLFKVNMISRLPNPVELSHEWVLKNSSIRIHNFTLDCLMSQKKDLLRSLQDIQRHMKKISIWFS